MIETTKRVVIEHYAREFAPTHGGHARVIYGDTDSVLVLFPCSVPVCADGSGKKLSDVSAAVAESFMFAVACSKAAAAVFPKPHDLEVEKAYLPYLLVNKKRYAGGLFMYDRDHPPGNAPEKISTSGLETVRRDNANMAPRQIQTVLDALMHDLAPDRAIAYAQDAAHAIIHGPVPAVAIAEGCAVAACDVLASVAPHASAHFRAAFLPAAIAALGRKDEDGAVGDGVLQRTPHAAEKMWLAAAREALAGCGGGDDNDTTVAAVLDAVSHTLRLNVTFDDHTISKKYGRNFEDYASVQPHIEMLKRMAKRGAAVDKNGKPKDEYAGQFKRYLGSRIDFVVAAPSPMHQGTRIADRAEDPMWAQLHGVLPDPVYYLTQLLGPLSRILKSLVGTKRAAYGRIMMYARSRPCPDRGFTKSRFKSDICDMIWGSYASGGRKRIGAPAVVARNEEKKAAAEHAKAVKTAIACGDAPPPPPSKRPRKVGPLDAFFTVAAEVADVA
jgi:hypothetical protein